MQAFKVIIERDTSISTLKKAIKAKKPNTFANVDASQLTIWKVNVAIGEEAKFERLNTYIPHEFAIQDVLDGEVAKDVTEEVGEVWTNVTSKHHIHVIVELPEGKNFKIQNLRILTSHDMECYRIRPNSGDSSVDLFGNYKGFLILAQCKNRRRRTGPNILRKLEGVLSRYPSDTTIGILVINSKSNFTSETVKRARTSAYNIILTDSSNLYSDLDQFVEERQTKASKIDIICQFFIDMLVENQRAQSSNKFVNFIIYNFFQMVFILACFFYFQ